MSTPLVQLTFALQSFEDPLSAAMRHTMEYEQLSLQANSLHCVTLQCLLPDDAHEGDIISLSATHPNARDAQSIRRINAIYYPLVTADFQTSSVC